jgi:hypothetical protein
MLARRVRTPGVVLVAATLLAVPAGCGDDGGEGDEDAGGAEQIEVVVASDTSSIAPLRQVRCQRVDDTQLMAGGIVESSGDDTHYVTVTVRFMDEDGVRVEIASDSVSELLVGESARWEATTYADGAADVRRCEVTATVS